MHALLDALIVHGAIDDYDIDATRIRVFTSRDGGFIASEMTLLEQLRINNCIGAYDVTPERDVFLFIRGYVTPEDVRAGYTQTWALDIDIDGEVIE